MEEKIKTIIAIIKKVTKLIIILLYLIFAMALIIGGAISGVVTFLPDEASKSCYLGYYAHCSFTPYSTIILFSMALLGLVLLLILIKFLRRE